MSQAAQSEDADFVPFAHIPVAQGRVGGDAGAQERRDAFQRQFGRNSQDIIFVHHDLSGIAAVGRRFAILLVAVVGGAHPFFTILFLAGVALWTFATGINEAADTGEVADFEFCDLIARLDHAADNFVSRHHGINRVAPFVAGLMDVGVADAAIEDLDLDVVGTHIPALEAERRKRICGTLSGIGFRVIHRSDKLTLYRKMYG